MLSTVNPNIALQLDPNPPRPHVASHADCKYHNLNLQFFSAAMFLRCAAPACRPHARPALLPFSLRPPLLPAWLEHALPTVLPCLPARCSGAVIAIPAGHATRVFGRKVGSSMHGLASLKSSSLEKQQQHV